LSDTRRLPFGCRRRQKLSAAVGSRQHLCWARIAPYPVAQHHLIVATAAIAATELDALYALGTLGFDRSAAIHARGVGLLSRNVVVFSENADLAQECFDSLEPSRFEVSEIAQRIPENPELDAALEERYSAAAGGSMRSLERRQSGLFRRHEHYLINALERTLCSKLNHGDIIALAEAGDSLRRTDAELHPALNVRPLLGLQLLHRSGLSAIALLAVQADRNLIAADAVTTLIDRHRALSPTLEPIRRQNAAAHKALGIEG
jgi:hypothetical protein